MQNIKVILCTNYFYKNDLPCFVFYTNKLKLLYCKNNDILYYNNSKLYYKGLHPVWFKLPMIRLCLDLCESLNDWVIWMDADAATVKMNYNIKDYLCMLLKKIIMLKDFNNFNAGVFAIPNTKRARLWINYIDLKRNDPRYKGGWRLQQAMIDSFHGSYSDFYKIPPINIGFNDYPSLHKLNTFKENESWCLHLPAWSFLQRSTYFYYYYNKLILNKNDIKIITPYLLYALLSLGFYTTISNKNIDPFYTGIALLLEFPFLRLEEVKAVGYASKKGHFYSSQQILESVNILKLFDIIVGPSFSIANNIIDHFIKEDLLMQAIDKDYIKYIEDFKKIFTALLMLVLQTLKSIHFGGCFITTKDTFFDLMKYIKDKLILFKDSKICTLYLYATNFLGYKFMERLLLLYCIRNNLKILSCPRRSI